MLWTPFFLPDIGGIETLMARLMPELTRRGHQLVLVTSHGAHPLPDETFHEGIPVHRFHFRSAVRKENLSQMLSILRKISAMKQEFQPDLVHLHVSDPSAFFHLKTMKAHPCPTLVSFHNTNARFPNPGSNSILQELIHTGGWFTTVSRQNLTSWIERYPELAGRTTVVHNGIEIPALEPAPLPFNPPHLLCLGRFIPQKRFDLAVQALGIIHADHPTSRLSIVGEGLLRSQLEEQATALGLGEWVKVSGTVSYQQVPALLNESTLVLMPSDAEGLPMAAIEAASMSRPLVATAVGGIPEVVIDGLTGWIVPPGEAAALAAAVHHLLSHPDQAHEMGQAGRRYILQKFLLENTVDGYEEIYHRLVSNHEH